LDLHRLDHLARSVAAASSRRTLFGLLAGASVVGGLRSLLEPDEAKAKDRRRRRKQRHKKRKNPGNRKKGCKPKSKAQVCAGTCGEVKNRDTCGKRVDCGSCACTPSCDACFTCQEGPNTPGTCVVDAAQQGKSCGSPGQFCQTDGTCACDAASCSGATPVCANGVCVCEAGSCSNPTPICTDGACVACTSNAQCGEDALCVDGECHACDVTCTAADHTCWSSELDAAIAAGGTIYVCPGRYLGSLTLTEDVNIIGAGQGTDPAVDTILNGAAQGRVVWNHPDVAASLRAVWITNGVGDHLQFGSGVLNQGQLSLTACTISGNETYSSAYGAGLATTGLGSTLEMTDCTVHSNTLYGNLAKGAGLYIDSPTTLTNCTIGPDNVMLFGEVSSSGGGIYLVSDNSGCLKLNNCNIFGNSAAYGGGITNNDGRIRIDGGSVTGNAATVEGADIYNLGDLAYDGTTIGECIDDGPFACGCPDGKICPD
jgi:hypothetical protein